RRFEFRALLNRVDELDEAVPARERLTVGTTVAWREATHLPALSGRLSIAVKGGRVAGAGEDDAVIVAPLPDDLGAALRDAEIIAHDFKSLPRVTKRPAEDTMIAA